MTICLDSGHGGKDSGAVNGSEYEKNYALLYAKACKAALLPYNNINVIMTRETDVYLTLSERCSISNNAKADFFVSFHHNAANGSANGYEVFCYNQSQDGYKQALSVYNEVKAANLFNAWRGVKSNSSLAVLNGTKCPAILVENGFIDNNSDLNIIKTKIDEITAATVAGIAKYYNLSKSEIPIDEPNADIKDYNAKNQILYIVDLLNELYNKM